MSGNVAVKVNKDAFANNYEKCTWKLRMVILLIQNTEKNGK